MYWVILEMKRSKGVLVASEASMKSALQWIDQVVSVSTEPVRIQLLDAQEAGGVRIEIDRGGIRAMKARRTKTVRAILA